jgi:biopolymer transport protein ExbD
MKKSSRSHHSTLNELNITPLLDLAFVLLVIFIITTPQLVNNLELNLPSAQVPPLKSKEPAKPHQVVVDAAGTVTLDGQTQTLPQLRTTLKSLKLANPDVALVIRGAPNADYQHVVRVLDIIQQLDITKMGLATETAQVQ